MLTSLLSFALANTPVLAASYDLLERGGRTRAGATVHLGLDLTGYSPALGARLDLGHRVAVEGRVVGGLPLADTLEWHGGGTLGVSVAPVRFTLGADGTVDLRLGAGASVTGGVGGKLAPWDLGGWLSSTLEVSPDGRWSLFGGAFAQDVSGRRQVLPVAGVRVRLD